MTNFDETRLFDSNFYDILEYLLYFFIQES